ncbi:hypothetical protein T492DRAFT_862149, partial [Pavlovales sp. CCMP2436]
MTEADEESVKQGKHLVVLALLLRELGAALLQHGAQAQLEEHVDVAALVTDARSLADATAMQVISSEPRALWTQPVALLWLVLAVVGAQ